MKLKKKTEEEKAGERAEKLLRSHLTDEEWESWDERGALHVKGSDGGKYVIRPGSFRPADTNGSALLARYTCSGGSCVTPIDRYQPISDYVLGIKLWVEADVEGFMEHLWGKGGHANRF